MLNQNEGWAEPVTTVGDDRLPDDELPDDDSPPMQAVAVHTDVDTIIGPPPDEPPVWPLPQPLHSISAEWPLLLITADIGAAAGADPVRTLTESQRSKIIEALTPFWQPGKQHELTIYLLGFLIKRGIARSESQQIIKAICEAARDEELNERLSQVSYHYENRFRLGSKLKGVAGLRELLGVEAI